MPHVYPFNATPIPPINEVGGKAHSLVTMTNAGFVVPNGFVCGASFFSDWNKQIEQSAVWKDLQKAVAKDADLSTYAEAVKAQIKTFELASKQNEEIDQLLKTLSIDSLYAVRSSSPEEDLEGSSFAGIYETVLGVDSRKIKQAILQVFLSAFDERVFIYKKAKGFPVDKVKIAVIIMEQIHSDTAGVGFSVNPINNDYDEAAVNANFGLGESVVSGLVTPDYFVVNKVSGDIISKKLGNKNKSVFIESSTEGGTTERTNADATAFSITDAQTGEIVQMIVKVEQLYGVPMDIEWAYSDGKLYMIQARPITTYIPIPEAMQTAPGDKKRTLYYDCSVLEGVTTNKPITTMTLDWTANHLGHAMSAPYLGDVRFSADGDPKTDIFFGKGVRLYMNFSQLLFLSSGKSMGKTFETIDLATAKALETLDMDTYLPAKKWDYLKWSHVVPFALKAAFRSHKAAWLWIDQSLHPVRFWNEKYQPVGDRVLAALKDLQDFDGKVSDYLDQSDKLLEEYCLVFMPVMIHYAQDLTAMIDMFKDDSEERKALADKLALGLEGDVAVDIGIQLYKLMQLLPADSFSDIPKLVEQLRAEQLPAEFLSEWGQFVEMHGMRGPNEMEIANGRYGDDPGLAFAQMQPMLQAKQDPADALANHVTQREQAYQQLITELPKKQANQLTKHYDIVHMLGPSRDTLKYVFVQINFKVRKLVQRDGAALAKAGRLELAEDAFFLTFDELEDTSADLKALVSRRKPMFESASMNVGAFPILIDSRGRIPTAALPEESDDNADPNVLKGNGISRGVARGRVKVFNDPREKKIEPGDVLVTYTTDPGWTPLFVGAEAIILEIGAVLQHGGLVAREYAKPCVAGIRGITEKLHDGQLVEVDGTNGTVKILSED